LDGLKDLKNCGLKLV